LDSPKIEYPCTWSFKIIGSDPAQITDTVVTMLEAFEYQFSKSRHSRTGKYTSWNLSVHVKNEEERLAIFNGLKHIPSVKVIL
jgi:putative lipoic acid-binding regulatory protein